MTRKPPGVGGAAVGSASMVAEMNGGGVGGGAPGESVKQDSRLVAATSQQLLVNTINHPSSTSSFTFHSSSFL